MTGRDDREKRTFLKDEDLHAQPDEAQDEAAAKADKLKRHGDDLQDVVDKATKPD